MGSVSSARHASGATFTPVPQLVQWLVTHRCPLRCPHCLSADRSGTRADELSLDSSTRLIEELAALRVPELLITGGEPTTREDLPLIVEALRAAGQHWSLNTALMPGPSLQRSLARWPPGFVAVSLDGPSSVHDAFRGRAGAHAEALQAIAYYRALTDGAVAAGTTVTRRNIGHLRETFTEVLSSGARTWGLHLLVPEGRAAADRSLFPTRAELRGLLSFALAKGGELEVRLADELGYCGLWEPLLRDGPFACGAGRAQCVVLADGEVVPCTTLDRTASAGNVQRRALREIWQSGFAELRRPCAARGCQACEHLQACGGGCWLQRRHGRACFRTVWEKPRRSARALAFWLGLSAGAGGAVATFETSAEAGQGDPPPLSSTSDQRRMQSVQELILDWYTSQLGGPAAPDAARVRKRAEVLARSDVGGRYLLEIISDPGPRDLSRRASRVRAALKSNQRSLCLIGLAWRDLTSGVLDGPGLKRRSEEERRSLREALAELGATAERWREVILADRLDPFLRHPHTYRHHVITKSGKPLYWRSASSPLAEKVAKKRGWTRPGLSAELLRQHPHGEALQLEVKVLRGEGLMRVRGGVATAGVEVLGPFDLIKVPAQSGGARVRLTLTSRPRSFAITLPAGVLELGYADLLRLVNEQHGATLQALLAERLGGKRPWDGLPFLLPALRTRAANSDRARHFLVDLYLF